MSRRRWICSRPRATAGGKLHNQSFTRPRSVGRDQFHISKVGKLPLQRTSGGPEPGRDFQDGGECQGSIGYILCMQPDEADYFRRLMALRSPRFVRCVETLRSLHSAMAEVRGRTRLISFCSDLIISAEVIDRLDGDCFNFHSGPPERPGFRPAAFASAESATEFGVTFHRMIAKVDAGSILAVSRFEIPFPTTEEAISELAYGRLLWLAAEVADDLANDNPVFIPLEEVWGARVTTRKDYERLNIFDGLRS